MARITFYDCTETDKQQLEAVLAGTNHQWEFVEDEISLDNLNPESEVISVFVSSTVTGTMIDKLPKLKLISCRSTGFNNIDFAAVKRHDVTVTNVPTYGEHTVAEYTIALLLSVSRKVGLAVQEVHSRRAHEPLTLRGFDLNAKTIGIVGMGKIGLQVARIAAGFQMNVIAYDPFPNEERAKEYSFSYVPLDELLNQSDVVSLHAPSTQENHHLINAEALQKMKSSAILINTARGELVDTPALVDALKNGVIAGAGLDVLEGEQLLSLEEELQLLRGDYNPELLALDAEIKQLVEMPNVVITPHNAYNTIEAVNRINRTAAENIISFFEGNTTNKVETSAPIGKLIVIRHGESEWNALGKWTGTTDVHLTEKGFHEAALLGQAVADLKFDYAYCSQQIRTLETLEGVLNASRHFDVPIERSSALNERDYGEYTGKNKWEVRDLIGEEAFEHLRRDWDYSVPGGETLKDVYGRVVPFYEGTVLSRLKDGQNVLLVAHGNSIRALIKHLEKVSESDIAKVEMPFGNVLVYDLEASGHMKNKQERKIETEAPPA